MYGKNKVTSSFPARDGSLVVNTLPWLTIQGEGPDAGRPAIFIRLAKCNLRCFFCDTEFERGERYSISDIRQRIVDTCPRTGLPDLLVITGGEPLLQNILPLVETANRLDMSVAIETAGLAYQYGLDALFAADRSIAGNIIVCSPKTPQIIAGLIPIIGAYKYIVSCDNTDEDDGLPGLSTQREGKSAHIFRPPPPVFGGPSQPPIYVQPMDYGSTNNIGTQDNMRHAAVIAMKYGYRLSIQLHKIVGVD